MGERKKPQEKFVIIFVALFFKCDKTHKASENKAEEKNWRVVCKH
jgi:hypothetical protein